MPRAATSNFSGFNKYLRKRTLFRGNSRWQIRRQQAIVIKVLVEQRNETFLSKDNVLMLAVFVDNFGTVFLGELLKFLIYNSLVNARSIFSNDLGDNEMADYLDNFNHLAPEVCLNETSS